MQLQSCWCSLQATRQDTSVAKNLKVAGYLANGGEISLASCLEWLREQGHTTYLPVIKHQYLMFAKLDSDTQFTNGKYNINVPVFDDDTLLPATQLDVVLLPLVAFDLHGARLGMGGGYYDRTFSFLLDTQRESSRKAIRKTSRDGEQRGGSQASGMTKPLMLGIAHEFQLQEKVPVEHWDVPLAGAITDQANYTMS